MAEVVSGECVCGFSTTHLTSGALMSGASHQITACYNCGVLETRPYIFSENGENVEICARCQQEMTNIYYKHDNKYRCPKCGKPELLLHTTTMVD